jgi:hypothetical protein
LDEEHGALIVDDLAALAAAASGLLADLKRWESLSARGRATAPAEVAWAPYVERVRAFLDRDPPIDAARAPRAGIGAALGALLDQRAQEIQARLAELEAQVDVARGDLAEATANQERLAHAASLHDRAVAERDAAIYDREALLSERDAMLSRLQAIEQSRSWRWTRGLRDAQAIARRSRHRT